jgi:hypothetical protein
MQNDDLIEQLVVNKLKDSITVLLHLKPLDEDDKKILRSLVNALSYFAIYSDYEKFYSEYSEDIETVLNEGRPEAGKFTVQCISENEDGSANLEIELGANVSKTIIGEGINFLLLKGIFEGTTDDILRWAELGKQQEKTDKLVNAFNEIYSEDTK